jgi:type VI secretion system protein ImpG
MTAEARAQQRDYFLREMAYLRDEGAAFAARHPRVAGALDISADGAADPHVERLVEAFAFLTGRVQRNLDHQLPRLASALLDALHPLLTAPLPSMAIAEARVDPARARAAQGFTLPRGTELTAETDVGATVRMRTGWDLEVWPFELASVDRPDAALLPFLDGRGDVGCALRLRLRCLGEERFPGLAPRRLRLRLAAPMALSTGLGEALLERTREVWAMDPETAGGGAASLEDRAHGRALRLRRARVAPVGFARDEAVLPDAPGGNRGHRLLLEWFAFPEKFLFVDLDDVDEIAGLAQGRTLDLILLLDAPPGALAAAEGGGLRMGAVPVVNLFSRISEPIRLDPGRIEHLIAPDARLERSTEIHAIRRVTLTRVEPGAATTVAPFFGFSAEGEGSGVGWIARRAPCRRPDMGGSDVHIAFRDRAFRPGMLDAAVAFAHLNCTNRGLAERLPVGARLGLEQDAPIGAILCATRPTPQADPPSEGADLWRLIAHLTADRLSAVEGAEALAALKGRLSVHCGRDSRAARAQIEGVVALATRRVARRVGEDAWRGFCRGIEVGVTLDEERFIGASGYYFGAVLARFLAAGAAPTGFVETVLSSARRKGEWARWPPMSGEDALI